MHAHRSPAVVEVAAVKGEDRLQTRACGYTAQSRRRDSNPQPADYETAALPLSYGGRMGVATHALSIRNGHKLAVFQNVKHIRKEVFPVDHCALDAYRLALLIVFGERKPASDFGFYHAVYADC